MNDSEIQQYSTKAIDKDLNMSKLNSLADKSSVRCLDKDAEKKTQSIAALLSSYDINVRVMNTSGFEDVGEMSHEQFKKLSLDAPTWSNNDRLKSLISTIKSGSLL